ncbi:hypothetical protein HYDPIDRAFT_187429 [Hydnomerulius pinastri MD-312]|uniref:Cytochrome P450 n=1 Tax=Hydnomerulius pinastri MD-312 TaxID=994086 RepID=A0A0C9VHA0_9AGAM|nr:hypothetical protein HYDPIDRAFT_187429 [Hydnomerulius pinastri MD-312]
MDSAGLLVCGLAVAVVATFAVDRVRWSKLDAIPVVGPSGHLTSYYGAAKFIRHAKSMLQEGYDRHKDTFFRVPMMDRWTVVLTGTELVEELRKIPDEKLSFDHAMQDLLQVKYTFGFEAQTSPYHVAVVKGHLKRNLSSLFPDIHDEICRTFDEIIPASETDWMGVQAYPAVMKATCRTSNRVFVGLPICQSTEFEDVQSKFALQVILRASLVNFFPKLMHPIIGRLLTNTPSSLRRCMDLLSPFVEERLRNVKQFGDHWPSHPFSNPEVGIFGGFCFVFLFLTFGCLLPWARPGRFFASTMMTAMMAHLVLNYDMKLEKEGVKPPDQWFQMNCSPNRTAEIMFKRVQTPAS